MAPDRVVVIVGTETGVGKTWVGAGVIGRLRQHGWRVAARKPIQSFHPDEAGATDADVLAAASGELPFQVCPAQRWYPRPMAPPMAAEALGMPPVSLGDLVAELGWSDHVDIGIVEAAGGVRSPLADDGDSVDLVSRLAPQRVVLVAGAGLGALNLVRMSLDALAGWPVILYLNGMDEADELHRRNRSWLRQRLGIDVVTTVAALAQAIADADPGVP
ncbi:MAG: dethiobiotin synthase [Actinomycetota bacterium]|nr:dethiobiotin synthase [Actinomycetota bacterium]